MPIRILIADDHAVFRSGLRALLEQDDRFRIVGEAGTGPETVEAARSDDVELLLLDLSLPGMPGSRVAEAVLGARPELAIVVLTMHEDPFYMEELFKIGVRGFVLKKSTGTDVVRAILAAHRGERYVDPALAGHPIAPRGGTGGGEAAPRRVHRLTNREIEVCRLLARGHTNAEVARKLFISERTVETHRKHIMEKLGLESRAGLVRFALENGLFGLS